MWKLEEQVAPTELSFLNASVLQTGRPYGASLFDADGCLYSAFPIRPVVKATINNEPLTTDDPGHPDRCRSQHGNMPNKFRTVADGHPTTDHGLLTTDNY